MASGVECAGLILAVLPIAIEAIKAYSSGAKTIRDVILPQYRDEKLEEFYEDLWWEMHIFSRQIRVVLDASSGLSDQQKAELETSLRSEDFGPRSTATAALKGFFCSEVDFLVFEQLLEKVARLLARLIENKSNYVRASELTQVQLLSKLQSFIKSRKDKKTSSTLRERLSLRMKEKDLQIRVANLQKWNKRLGILIKQGERRQAGAGSFSKDVPSDTKRPSTSLSAMPRILYNALFKYWACDCEAQHEAKFCLRLPQEVHQSFDPTEVDFELLLSAPKEQQDIRKLWQECKVHVRKQFIEVADETSKVSFIIPDQYNKWEEKAEVKMICQEVKQVYRKGHCLCLLAEGCDDSFELWRVRSAKRELKFIDTEQETSLHSALENVKSMPLPKKRALALMLAYALVLLDGSPWLGERWTKKHITFPSAIAGQVDYMRPYITSCVSQAGEVKSAASLDILHPNISILSLGILLIEIETGRSIEDFRTPEDLLDGMEIDNTDFSVADRVARALQTCTPDYQEAIFACLDVPWRLAGKRVTLEDPHTRQAVYRTIISRLERELECLGIDLMAL